MGSYYVAEQPIWAPAPLAAVMLVIVVLSNALRLVRQRRLVQAVVMTAISNWSIVLVMAFVVPPLFVAFATLTIWPVLQAIPYVDRRTLRRLVIGTIPVASLAVAFSVRDDPYGLEDTIGSTGLNAFIIVLGAILISLTVLLVWQSFIRLENTLSALGETNAALIESESALERKVEERTAQLTETFAYMAAVVENLGPGLVAVDSAGRPTQVNESFLRMFGTTRAAIEMPAELSALLAEPIRDGVARTRDIALRNGRIGKAVATAIEVVNEGNGDDGGVPVEVVGTVVLVDDVTAEREVDRMKTDFISTVSHELRTPLTSVLGFARMVQKRLDTKLYPHVDRGAEGVERAIERIDGNLEIILSEGDRLTNLINDVLDVAKMEAGRVEWQMVSGDVAEAVAAATAATASLFDGEPVELVVDVPDDLPPVVHDEQRLVQVFINLLSNARKFTDVGAVTVAAAAAGDAVTVTVSDTGIGVAPEDVGTLFERFRQVGDTLTDRPTGTGLGLPICKEIVDAHGGSIDVTSELGGGSAFVVSLPRAEA